MRWLKINERSLISHDYDGQYVVSNLSGIQIYTILKISKIDVWKNTKIENGGIYILGNQNIKSPIASDVLEYMSESRKAQKSISPKQQDMIISDTIKNVNKIQSSEIFQNRKIDSTLNNNKLFDK